MAAARPGCLGAQPLAMVVAGVGINDGITPGLYALKAGIFRRMGLDVHLQSGPSGAALAAGVVGATIDIANTSIMPLIVGYQRGIPFKIVAGSALYTGKNPTSQMSVLKSSSIMSPADLNEKTVVVNALKSLDQLGVDASVDKAGGDASTLKFIELPFPAMLPALESRRADLAVISVPTLASDLETGKVRTLGDSHSGIGQRFLLAAWFCSAAYAERNPTIVRRFGAAISEATVYANAHHDETAEILAAYSHIDVDVIRKMNRLTNASVLNPQEIQLPIDAAARFHYIDQGFSAKELLLN